MSVHFVPFFEAYSCMKSSRLKPSRYLDPKIDLAFKLVFGEHKELLRSFLNALLPLPTDALIERLEYLSAEQVPRLPGAQKRSILDVKCFDTRGRIFIVEMQMYWSASFEKRIVFEAAQAYVKQLPLGQPYDDLQPVYALALSNSVFRKNTSNHYHHYKIVHCQEPDQVLKGLEFVFIELPKFSPASWTEKRMAIKWLRFMNEVGLDDQTLDAELLEDPLIGQAIKLMEVAKLSAEQLEYYDGDLDRARVEGMYARDARAEGKAEGKAEILRRQIIRKFKVLPVQYETQIAQADVVQLDVWLDRIFDVGTLQALFDPVRT
jgi:predicted transposase/invertase (TIGR01784 family)